jgi:hypothetical protein
MSKILCCGCRQVNAVISGDIFTRACELAPPRPGGGGGKGVALGGPGLSLAAARGGRPYAPAITPSLPAASLSGMAAALPPHVLHAVGGPAAMAPGLGWAPPGAFVAPLVRPPLPLALQPPMDLAASPPGVWPPVRVPPPQQQPFHPQAVPRLDLDAAYAQSLGTQTYWRPPGM